MRTFKIDDEVTIQADDCVQGAAGGIAFVKLEKDGLASWRTVAAFNRDDWSTVMSEEVQAYADAVEKLKHLAATREHTVGVAVARLATMQGSDGRALSPSEMFNAIDSTLRLWLDVPDQPMRVRATLPDVELTDRAW